MNQIPGQVFIIYLDVSLKNENVNLIVAVKERSREHHQNLFPKDHQRLVNNFVLIHPLVVEIRQRITKYFDLLMALEKKQNFTF